MWKYGGQGRSTDAYSGSLSLWGQDLAKHTSHPGTRTRAGMFYADASYTCMGVRKLWHTHRDMCGNRFSSHAEQLLIFKRKKGQGFKWSLHIMQVSLCKIIYVFVGMGFKSPRPQALWLYPPADSSLLLSFKALCYPVQFSASS